MSSRDNKLIYESYNKHLINEIAFNSVEKTLYIILPDTRLLSIKADTIYNAFIKARLLESPSGVENFDDERLYQWSAIKQKDGSLVLVVRDNLNRVYYILNDRDTAITFKQNLSKDQGLDDDDDDESDLENN